MTIAELDKALEEVGCEVTDLTQDSEKWTCGCGRPAIRHLHWKNGAGNQWNCERHWLELATRPAVSYKGHPCSYLGYWQELHLDERSREGAAA